MRHVNLPPGAQASHEAVLALAEKAFAANLDGNVRVIVARDPRDVTGAWRPACGRLDISRCGDPAAADCAPTGPVRILEERVDGGELLRRLRLAMGGAAFEVCGEHFTDHGMDSAWAVCQHTWDWREYGTTWPCTVAAPHAQIPRRVQLYEIIEDDGPHGAHDGLDALVQVATGFRVTRGPGLDIRFSRFQLHIWDYRGRIDSMEVEGKSASIEVSPKHDPALRLVGLISGQHTREPVAVTAPARTVVTLEEPVLMAKLALKIGDDLVAEAQRDFVQEFQIATLEGRAVAPSAAEMIIDALTRSLRPAFDAAPTSEKEVQREVEKILRTLGFDFHREKERAAVGATTFVPDFTIPDFGIAIEVKVARSGHRETAIQHELAEDAAGYGTTWPHVLVVVYDCGGVIRDPEAMRHANALLGLDLLVVKH